MQETMTADKNKICLHLLVINLTNCTNGDIRLMGGANQLEGRVEMCHDNQWGTVCDHHWDARDASVACGQLGFANRGKKLTMSS